MNAVLQQRWVKVGVEPSDIIDHLPTFVRTIDELDATRVIEIGTRYGVSTIAWLYGLEERGHLWSVDCAFPVAAPGSDVNLLDPQGPLGVIPWWTFVLGYCEWPAVLAALPTQVDVVFIDANHVYEETLEQLRLYVPRVRPGGRVLLHDTAIETTGNASTPQPPFPVRTAVDEFCTERGLKWENDTRCCGLGTIYIPASEAR